tara:strand:+ start:31 stop:1104 length:1074 start_codon:yes stop_codon:yes gene_type:complete
MENQELNQAQNEENTGWSFVSDEEIQAAQAPQQEEAEQPVEQTPQPEAEVSEPIAETPEVQADQAVETEEEISDEEFEATMLGYLSERLGRSVDSFDDLNMQQEAQLDERVEAIAKFVSETGRSPQDWFLYQSLNTSEMDDMTAISINMTAQYPNLSQEEVNTLIGSKYKLDSNLHTEDEIKLSQLQLKMDAESARNSIAQLRDGYAAPQVSESQEESFVTEDWVSDMRSELNALEAVEFDLGNGQQFNFGLEDAYKNQLAEKNSRLDDFFDPYVQQDGSWDHDKFNMHMAVLDNIETIVSSVYKQGMADGQRGLVDQAANVSTQTPNQGNVQPTEDSLTAQLREALGGSSTLSFKI